MGNLLEEALTRSIIAAFFAVYNTLGFGLSERVYVLALKQELIARGHTVELEVTFPVFYRGVRLQSQRLDMVVDGRVVIEVKVTPTLHPSARQQLHNYLRLTRYQVGLLFRFGPEPAFTRLIHTDNGKQSSAPSR